MFGNHISIGRLIKLVFLAALLAFTAKVFIAEAYKIPSSSMEDTLLPGDFVIVNKFSYGPSSPEQLPFTGIDIPHFSLPRFSEIKRNNIYIFLYPGDPGTLIPEERKNYIKRCVGLPGDTLRILAKKLYVNGEELLSPPGVKYLRKHNKFLGLPNDLIFPGNTEWNEDNYGPIVIPYKNQTIRLNTNNISRWRDIINREAGSEVVVVNNSEILINDQPAESYKVINDYYFFIGDNRDESFDSRFWGFVPAENIIGKPLVVYWSVDMDDQSSSLFGNIRWDRIGKIIK